MEWYSVFYNMVLAKERNKRTSGEDFPLTFEQSDPLSLLSGMEVISFSFRLHLNTWIPNQGISHFYVMCIAYI